MILKVPKHIKLGPYIYQGIFSRHLKHDDGLVGALQLRTELLKLDPSASHTAQEVTFLHEGLHGVNNVMALGLDEDTVDRLAHGLLQFLQDNFGVQFDFGEWSEE